MREARQQTPPLDREDAILRRKSLAAEFTDLGLTNAPGRMCTDVRKVPGGWAIFTGYQDTDD